PPSTCPLSLHDALPIFLQLLHQAGLGIARRRLGEMLLGNDVAALEAFVLGDVGQDGVAFLVVAAVLVLALIIEGEEAVELHDRADRKSTRLNSSHGSTS